MSEEEVIYSKAIALSKKPAKVFQKDAHNLT